MLLKRKKIIFFLILTIIIFFIPGCAKHGAQKNAVSTPVPSSTNSTFQEKSSMSDDRDYASGDDPFRRTLPIEKSPDYFITKEYQGRVPDEGVQALLSNERKKILPVPLVVKTLKIKQGMEILDIGAGEGTFTFPMADELKNTGRVYATEVEPKLVQDMQNYMGKDTYKNVTPVLVARDGVDPFYKKHQFDIILVCETIPCLRDITAYFRELRPSLKKGGRLYIINFKNVSDFHEADFGHFGKTLVTLHVRGEKFPIFKKLDKEVQDYIKSLPEDKIHSKNSDEIPYPPSEIRAKIIKNFNQMLSDRFLLNDLVDYFDSMGYYKQDKDAFPPELEWPRPFILVIHPAELSLFKWLYVHLDGEGVFDKDNKTLNDKQKEKLQKLNKIILSGIFHLYTVSIVKGEFQPAIFLDKKSIIAKMKKAGYKLVKDYDILSQYFFLEFESL